MKTILLILFSLSIISSSDKNLHYIETNDNVTFVTNLNTIDFDKNDLYHNAMMIHVGNKEGSIDYLKKNNPSLYHHARIFIGDDSENSTQYLKENNLALFHNIMLFSVGDEYHSIDYLKKHEIDLYHHAMMLLENKSSAQYLKINNSNLYHHALLVGGVESALDYFKTQEKQSNLKVESSFKITWINRNEAKTVKELNDIILKKENYLIAPIDFFKVSDNSFIVFAGSAEQIPKYYRYDFSSDKKFLKKSGTSLDEIKSFVKKYGTN